MAEAYVYNPGKMRSVEVARNRTGWRKYHWQAVEDDRRASGFDLGDDSYLFGWVSPEGNAWTYNGALRAADSFFRRRDRFYYELEQAAQLRKETRSRVDLGRA